MRIVEVGPRDGLQNEEVILATEDKVRLIEMLVDAGFREIEVSSFVHPRRVPQLADAAEVFAALTRKEDDSVRYSALVPNAKGLERALEAGVRAIALFTAASETFTQQNIGMSIADSLDSFRALMPTARASGLWVRAYLSTAFVCPYEGVIAPAQVLPVLAELRDMGVDEISLGDTIGHAEPDDVSRLTEALLTTMSSEALQTRIAYHFHDTRKTAVANVRRALTYGIRIFDSAVGGVGGCPFAPGAAGNLASEDLLALLHEMGFETGIDPARVAATARFLKQKLGRE